MNRKRFGLYIFVVLFSVTVSMAFTFLYGQFFSHDRYWDGTIKRVRVIDLKIIEGVFSLNGIESVLKENPDNLGLIFEPLRGKIPITIYDDNLVIYTNIENPDTLSKQKTIISVRDSKYILEIGQYTPPTWINVFYKWLSHPGQWFSSKFDSITVQFFTMFMIFLCFFYAMLWRLRAVYLSNDVKRALDSIDFENQSFRK